MAGHLCGRALQEWGLLTAHERKSLEEATAVLRSRLDRSSRALAAQDFQHASQHEGESAADFIRRLEQLFKLAYGRDNMSEETRGTLLHGQLQEALRYEIMKAPAVSGSHGYKELCLASRNEERRLAELAKRRQYSKPSRTSLSVKNQHDQSSKDQGTKSPSELLNPQGQQQEESRSTTHYTCNQPVHLSRECPSQRTEDLEPQRDKGLLELDRSQLQCHVSSHLQLSLD